MFKSFRTPQLGAPRRTAKSCPQTAALHRFECNGSPQPSKEIAAATPTNVTISISQRRVVTCNQTILPEESSWAVSVSISRRATLLASAVAGLLTTGAVSPISSAEASKLPGFADRAWETMGGGPADLTFPPSFLGVWDVRSILVKVDLPMGEEVVPDMAVVKRAQQEDLNQTVGYQVSFVRNKEDEVIYDRAFNTASMLSFYYAKPAQDFLNRIDWDAMDPNVLELRMPGGMSVRTRVTRRMEEKPEIDRIETSEFFEQVYDNDTSNAPRLKASQCYTKYKWRDESVAGPGQPSIVATQVVSDFLTPTPGNDSRFLQAMNKPIVQYTYRMAFTRASTPQPAKS